MNQGTKQRIVGTVVLLALALIFLPIIFDGQGSYQVPVSSRIPDAPEVPVLAEPEQSRPVIIADGESTNNSSNNDTDADDETDPDADGPLVVTSEPAFSREVPTLDGAGLPQGWSVRLGTFSEEANATNLMQRLQAAGYKAYTRSFGGQRGRLVGVYVGPWLERERVDEYRRLLQEEFQLNGIVERYETEQL